ncbi:nuclear transport factor 2 family protein [Brevundimonas goettingensis]|uniref:Nuclear transport factor 2 family protein n=1 Tax=Brevundimonas goettingensis TaxID=2774190 RepID=A0A975GXP1_9CAUL|nr:nuclear transport factor 2 family protein [Brevundimonas goettingensis]QTC93113.1 nuclear transport factor 2 family protein [Brevundimonas goettingensis]
MTIPALFLALVLAVPGQGTAPSAAVTVPAEPALSAAIGDRDAVLFRVMSDDCDPAALSDLVTEDLEFYHDRGGLMAGRTAFVADYARGCEAKKAPDAFRSRRELVPGSMRVYAIPGSGAVEEGTHLFYERQGDGPEKLVGRARFSMFWKLDADGQWRLARAFSIDHAAASAPPSAN